MSLDAKNPFATLLSPCFFCLSSFYWIPLLVVKLSSEPIGEPPALSGSFLSLRQSSLLQISGKCPWILPEGIVSHSIPFHFGGTFKIKKNKYFKRKHFMFVVLTWLWIMHILIFIILYSSYTILTYVTLYTFYSFSILKSVSSHLTSCQIHQ